MEVKRAEVKQLEVKQRGAEGDVLDATFAALADPTRRAILARLTRGEATVTELATPFTISQPAITKHLKVLESAGLISRGRERQWRPARLEARPLKEVAEWTERYRRFWEESYERLDEYLDELQGRGKEREMGESGSSALRLTTPSDLEIVMTRVFDAPRDLVFEAHSSCEHLSRWWAPRGYEIAGCEVDFRPEGSWRIVQRGPDGEEYAFRGDYREIVRPERIVWTFEFEGMPGNVFVETMTFEEHDGKTTLASTSVFDSVEARDGMLESGMESGAVETYDRLDEYLEVLREGASS